MWATIELSFKQIDFIGLIILQSDAVANVLIGLIILQSDAVANVIIGLIILQSDAVANVIGFQLDAVATIFFTV